MIISGRRGVGIGRRPTIHGGIVSPAGVKPNTAPAAAGGSSTPDDHFTASPYCRVLVSGVRCIGRAGTCPTVCAGIRSGTTVGAAGLINRTAPDDHLITVSPY